MPPNGDPAHNPGMCPDQESNQRPFDSQADAQSTEPHQGLICIFNKVCVFKTSNYIPNRTDGRSLNANKGGLLASHLLQVLKEAVKLDRSNKCCLDQVETSYSNLYPNVIIYRAYIRYIFPLCFSDILEN